MRTLVCRLLALAAFAAAAPAIAQQDLPANGLFLVAKPSLLDPNFARTVVLVTQTEDASTVGVIINRPSGLKLQQFLSPEFPTQNYRDPIFVGGPVMRQAIVALYHADAVPEAPAFHVLKDVYLTMHPDNIQKLLAEPKARYRLYAGFSGWAPRQLESEFMRDGWYVLPADEAMLFRDNPEGIWEELAEKAMRRGPQTRGDALQCLENGPRLATADCSDRPSRGRVLACPGAGAGRRGDDPGRAPRVPRPRLPADGAARGAGAQRRPRRGDPKPADAALAEQPVPGARTIQEGDRAGVLRRAVFARRAGGAGEIGGCARRRIGPVDEEPLHGVPRQHHRPGDRNPPQRRALLRRLRRLAPRRAQGRDRPRHLVGAERRHGRGLPQGRGRHVGRNAAADPAHPRGD